MTVKSGKKQNNRGASLVMVILTIALVSVMVFIVMMLVLMNFKMKSVDAAAKKNFYTAETAVDEIKAGLESDVSSAYTDAYILVLQQYTATTESDRSDLFKNNYALDLKDALLDTSSSSENSIYSLDKLRGYVTQTKLFNNDTGVGITVEAAENREPVLAFTTRGVILKNLVVTYWNKQDYESRVKTDILLSFPDIDFTQTSNTPNLLEYALVANDSLTLDTTAAKTTVTGSVYGGKKGITLPTSSNLTINSGKVIMTNGDITLNAGASLATDANAGLWAKNLNITSGSLDLKGSTYIANDLLIKDQSSVSSTIKLSGNYYGFGNPDTAKLSNYITDKSLVSDITNHPSSYSSAILLNGTNVSVDLSDLSRLMLAGNSYIGTTLKNTAGSTNTNTADVRMGESLSVKSNQIAYLVPEKYVGIGSEYGGMNPMTLDQYNALKAEVSAGTASFVDTAGMRTATGAVGYQAAFYPYSGSSIVYFYMTFDNADTASAFFRNYYNINSEKVNDYLSFYTTGITYSSKASAVFNLYGNAMVYDANNGGSLKTDTNTSGDGEVLAERQTNMQNIFGALGIKLITSYIDLTSTEKTADDVFANLVETAKMTQGVYTSDLSNHLVCSFDTANTNYCGIMTTASDVTLKNGENGTNNTTNTVIKSKSDGKIEIYVGNESSDASKKLRVLLTTGNVTVESGCNFHGLIISAGKVTLNGGSSVTYDALGVAKVLQVSNTVSGVRMMDYLKDASSYVLSGAASGSVDSDQNTGTAVSDLIEYRHWKKE